MAQDAGGTLPITAQGAPENKRGKQRSCYSPFSSAPLDQLLPGKYDTQKLPRSQNNKKPHRGSKPL